MTIWSAKRRYSAVAVLSEDLDRVVLIHKQRPDWQAGKANLPGGKVEAGDCIGFKCAHCQGSGWIQPASEDLAEKICWRCKGSGRWPEKDPDSGFRRCATRELAEETGLVVDVSSLKLFCRLRFKSREGDDAECCFYAVRGDVDAARTMEAERVFVGHVHEICPSGRVFHDFIENGRRVSQWLPTMPNLPYLVAMARQCLRGEGAGAWPLTVYENGAVP